MYKKRPGTGNRKQVSDISRLVDDHTDRCFACRLSGDRCRKGKQLLAKFRRIMWRVFHG